MFSVSIDTNSFSDTAARLAFDFIDGDSVINNTAINSGFGTDGTLDATIGTRDVTGKLPGNVTIGDTDFFNELLQQITRGRSVYFTLTLTENKAGHSAAHSDVL